MTQVRKTPVEKPWSSVFPAQWEEQYSSLYALCWWNNNNNLLLTLFLLCGSEDMLKVEGMDLKLSEPITAAHLISAARSGNSKAEAVLNKGERTELFFLW